MRTNVLADFPHPAVPELSYQLAGLSSREELIDASMEMLSRLISCDGIVWNAVDVGQGTVEVYGRPAVYTDPVWSEVLLQVDDHPMVVSYLLKPTSTAPRRISDICASAVFRKTRTYADLFKPLGVAHQLTVLTARLQPSAGRTWTFNRNFGSFDFADDERSLAELIQPVLAAIDRGLPPPGPPSAPAPSLTAREIQVLAVVSQGLTAHACGHVLRISERTVRKHLEHAYAKLGCHDRLSAVLKARRLGLF
jgi:DNA-binding CsgD family transcriptional regulator